MSLKFENLGKDFCGVKQTPDVFTEKYERLAQYFKKGEKKRNISKN